MTASVIEIGIQKMVIFQNVATAIGGAGGISLVCANLPATVDYNGQLVVPSDRTLSGPRFIVASTLGGVITPDTPFDVQIPAGTEFIILSTRVPISSLINQGLAFMGQVTDVPGVNQFTIDTLKGKGDTFFVNWSSYVAWTVGGVGAAPQGEDQAVSVYTSAAGVFTTPVYTAAVGIGDWIILLNPLLANTNFLRLIMAELNSSGQLYAVNPNAPDDTGSGLSIANPKMWTNSGVVLCTNGNGDKIIRLPGAENIDDDDVDPPVVMDKRAVIIVGIGGGHPEQQGEVNASIRRRQNAAWGAAAGPAIDIQAPCSIEGIEVVAVAQPAIQFEGNGGDENGAFSHIFKCRFPGWGLMTNAIYFAAGTYNKIEACRFESLTSAIIFASTIGNNPDYNDIIDNWFVGCTFGIDTIIGSAPHNTVVKGCHFIPSNTAAMTNAIRTLGLWDSGEISGNYFGCTRAQAYDIGVYALRAAGVMVYGNTYTDGTDEELDNAEQITVATIDLNQAAANYTLFTGDTELTELESLVLVCPNAAAGGALTSISIQTDDATPQVIITNVAGAVANLTAEAQIAWSSGINGPTIISVGTNIQLTINGGATGVDYVCTVVAKWKPVVAGGLLI